MKKIIYSLVIMIAAGSLFTSCIQQLEPTGIQEMREAKAEYYEALAGLKNADAEYRQAQARYEDARTKLKEAEAKAKELLNAQQELNNAKLKATNEAEIAERKAQCEAKLVEWQTTITNNQKDLAKAEYELQDKLREIAALSMGLTETEKSVLNAAISGYEDAIKKYNEAVAALYCAQFDLYEAQYDKAAGIGDTDYDDEEVEYAESYEDSVVFYEAVEAYYAEKLAEYVFTDDPAVWEAELEEIADSIATWEYNANIIDADMAKKFANEYYDGVKAWNEAYAAYVEANEPQKDPNLKAPDGYLFHKDGKPADYTKQLPVHTPATDKFVSHFNSYLMEWCDYVKRWRWTFPVEKAYIYTEKKGAEDVFVVEDLRIDNYDLFLNGNPDDKDVLGLNGILETLERDLVLQGDATTVAKLKEEKEAAEKKFYSADSVVRDGLFGYKPFTDTLDLAKKAVANMNEEAKAIADAQTALVKAAADYAKGIGLHSVFDYGNPIASYADSVALFNAIKNFAKARADYFGDGSILAEYYDIPEITGKTAAEIAAMIVKYLNTLPYYTYDGSFTAKKDSVNLEDIEFSGFQQSPVYPNSFIALVPKPWHIKPSGVDYAVEMYFNSLYGGEGLENGPSHPTFKSPVWYPGYMVNMTGVTATDSTTWWAAAYYLGQQIPAMHAEEDAFIKAVAKIYFSGFGGGFGGFDDDPVEFWADIYGAYEEASMNPAALAEYTSKVGLYGAQTEVGEDKNIHVVIDGNEVVSQEVIKLLYAVYNNFADYCDIYNAYWGGDGSEDGDSHTDLARQNLRAVDKQGNEHAASAFVSSGEIKWVGLVKALVEGEIVNVIDVENSYHWSVKTFTEPYNIVNFEKAWSDRVVYVVDNKELEIVFDNLPIEYSVRGNAFLTAIFNGSKDMTLLAKMLYAEQVYDMYANAKDAIEIVKQLKGVDAEVKAAAAEVTKAYEAYYTALTGYGQDYVTFYKTLTGDVKGADDTVKANTTDGVVNWDAVVAALYTTVHKVMTKANENYILNQIKDDQWTVGGEMKAMAEKFLPTYPADLHAAEQLKGHSEEMIKLYEGLYYALDKTYLTAVQMKDPELIGKVVEHTVGQGRHQRTETYVVEPRTFKQAYENLIDNCSSAIEYCENKIAFFEKMIALVEAGFGPVDARISALEAQVEYYTQKLVDAQVQLDVAKAKYDEAVAAYAE